MRGRLLVQVCDGGSYAPCAYYYRIVNEREHRRAMAQVAASGGPVPDDPREDSVLLSEDFADAIVPARHRSALHEGYTVRFLADRWEAFSYYGYDAGDTLA
jgi:hypothetical protein